MATPTPSGAQSAKHSLNAHSIATPPALSHLPNFTSPAPRSVPSPAAHRNQQAGKSPFNTASHAPSVGSTATAQNHPTGSSGKGGMGGFTGSSPAVLDIGTPAGLGMGFGSLGGVEMGIGMSLTGSQMGLGLGMGMSGSMGPARIDDEERRKRLEAVIATLRATPGRVSDEGIERLATRCGMSVLSEPSARDDGVRELAIAGQTLMVEMTTRNNIVQTVAVQWPEQNEELYAKSAAALLKENLTPPPGVSSINFTLDKFARNLERLARLDKLEGPNFNSFEAISGVYTSLKRLYEHEKKTALALFGSNVKNREERAVRDTTCKKSGRPRLNERGALGLSIDYFMKDRFSFDEAATEPDANAMEVDGHDDADASEDDDVFSIIIDCESHPSALYPAVRTSNAWVSEFVEKTVDEDGLFTEIDWQEPEPTYLHNPHEGDQSADQVITSLAMGSSKLPNIRFVARLSPPLVVPAQVLYYILSTVSSQPDNIKAVSYDGLLFSLENLDEYNEHRLISGEIAGRTRQSTRDVLLKLPSGEEHERQHTQNLHHRHEYGALLKEFPFSHPNQVINVLPILRQYAALSSLLKNCFDATTAASPSTNGHAPTNGTDDTPAFAVSPLSIDVYLRIPSFNLGPLSPMPHPTNPQLDVSCANPATLWPPPATPVAPPGNMEEDKPDGDAPSSSPAPSVKKSTTRLVNYSSSSDAVEDPSLQDVLSDDAGKGDAMDDDMPQAELPPTLSLMIEIAPNGSVEIREENIVASLPHANGIAEIGEKNGASGDGDGDGEGKVGDDDGIVEIGADMARQHEREAQRADGVRRLGGALEVAGDVGVWVEWLGRETVRLRDESSKRV